MRRIVSTKWAALGVTVVALGGALGGCVAADDDTASMRGRSAYEARRYYVTDSLDRGASNGAARPPSSTSPPAGASAGGEVVSTAAVDDAVQRGESIRHMPADCERVGYADLKGLAASDPVRANAALLAVSGAVLVDRHAGAHAAALHSAAGVFADRGIDWRKDGNDAAVCMNGSRLDVLAVAGTFGDRDVLGAIAEAGRKSGEPTRRFEESGHDWVKVGPHYVTLARRGVVLIGSDKTRVEAGRNTSPDLLARGGMLDDLVFYQGPRPGDRKVTFSLAQQGDDSFIARTTITLSSGSYDAHADRNVMRDRIDRLTHDLASTPLAPLAPAVSRTEMVFHGDQLAMRTVLPSAELTEAVKNAASSTGSEWQPLADLLPIASPGTATAAIGGGPTTPAVDNPTAENPTAETPTPPPDETKPSAPSEPPTTEPKPAEPPSSIDEDAGPGDTAPDAGTGAGDSGTEPPSEDGGAP